ncbi:MAG: SdrD B-like domain-containing protein, partial [Saprospiraceae bacterium]
DSDCPCNNVNIPNLTFNQDGNGAAVPNFADASSLWSNYGITVSTSHADRIPLIYNSESSAGSDPDLRAPNMDFGGLGVGDGGKAGEIGQNDTGKGNLIVISTSTTDNGNGDYSGGGSIYFDFANVVNIFSIEVIDVDYGEVDNFVRCYDYNNAVLSERPLIAYGDNSYQTVLIDQSGVSRMEIHFDGSGSIASMQFCEDTDPAGAETPEAKLVGKVWNDKDGDGFQSSSEPGQPNVELELEDDENHKLAVTTTDEDGEYTFENLSPGDYKIKAKTPSGSIKTFSAGSPTLDDESEVKTLGEDVTIGSMNFGFAVEICNNGIDDDNNGLTDCDDPYCSGVGATEVMVESVSIDFPENATGLPDAQTSEVYDGSDRLVLDLGQTVAAGDTYSIVWKRKDYGTAGTAIVYIDESSDNSNWTIQAQSISTTEDTDLVTDQLTASVNTRYIRLSQENGSGDDFDFDAAYSTIACGIVEEICDNGIDDDNDGLVDCDDPDCSVMENTGMEIPNPAFTYPILLEGSTAQKLASGSTEVDNWVASINSPCMYYIKDTEDRVNNPEGDYFVWLSDYNDCFISTDNFEQNALVDGEEYTISFHAAAWSISLDASCEPDGGAVTQGSGLVYMELEDNAGNYTTVATHSLPVSPSWTELSWERISY